MEESLTRILIAAVVLEGIALIFLFAKGKYASLCSAGLLLSATAAVGAGVLMHKDELKAMWTNDQFMILTIAALIVLLVGAVTAILDIRAYRGESRKQEDEESL